VLLEASTIDGNVQLDIGGAITPSALRVEGSIQLVANRDAIHLTDNRVGSDVQVFENRGGAVLNGNTADGHLQCKQNTPAPTGSSNRAASKEDQCSAL